VHDLKRLSGSEAREIEAEILVGRVADPADGLAGTKARERGGTSALDGSDLVAAQEKPDVTTPGTVGKSPDGEQEDDRPRRPGGTPRSIQKSALSAGAQGA
jgi:hypothetical protein